VIPAFLLLLGTEALGTAAFLAVYLRGDWRATPVGRHLALYASALLAVYATTLASVFIHAQWLIWLILAMHVVFDVAIWQRVYLVWRAHRA
jgi:hypothetical protein